MGRFWSTEAIRDTKATTPRPLVYLALVVLALGMLLAGIDMWRGIPWP